MTVVVCAVILVGCYLLSVYFGIGPALPFMQYEEINVGEGEQVMIAEDQLMALADTEEMAREIADQYGIELRSFANGIAVYRTEEDLFEVMERGRANGYAELSINFIRTLDEEQPLSEQQPD